MSDIWRRGHFVQKLLSCSYTRKTQTGSSASAGPLKRSVSETNSDNDDDAANVVFIQL